VLAFIIRRILQSVAVMAVVAFIAFGLFNFTGDPVTFMVGQDATQEERARLRSDLGLDLPFYVQFGRFVGRASQGDFGLSLRQGRKVSTLLKERLPATLELAFVAAVLALVLGVPAGVYTALRRDSWLSQLLLAISLIGASVIWGFMYAWEPAGQPQIGLLNAAVVAAGGQALPAAAALVVTYLAMR